MSILVACLAVYDTLKAWHDVDKYLETAIDNANTLFFRFYMFIFKSMHNGCMCTVIKYVVQEGRGTSAMLKRSVRLTYL